MENDQSLSKDLNTNVGCALTAWPFVSVRLTLGALTCRTSDCTPAPGH